LKLFITGVSGLLGLNFALQCQKQYTVSGAYFNHPVSIPGVKTLRLDLTSQAATEKAAQDIRPDIIVHTAALADVDECEANPDLAHRLNVVAARNVATVANTMGLRLVHISTDQLFNGERLWKAETDAPAPINRYGSTKWLAEKQVLETCPQALVIRTNFFGWGTAYKRSFSDWILRGLEEQRELTLFSDVYFTPILINQLIDVITSLVRSGATGVFHVAGGERLSKYTFARRLAETFNYPSDLIRPISVDEFSFKAQRPKEMSLACGKAELHLRTRMPLLQDGLDSLHRLWTQKWPQALERSVQAESPS
jgi:dTDP-4-dehydrorhamnose reductase